MGIIEIPDPSSPAKVADWAELIVSTTGNFVSRASIDSLLEAAGGKPDEAFVSSIWMELSRREKLYARPFFIVQDSTVEPSSDSGGCEYQACLLLSLFGIQDSTNDPAKLFERLSCEAIKRYLSGNALVFGWPQEKQDIKNSNGSESQIKRKIRMLAESLGERFIEAPRPSFKDRGIDAVGWIPFQEKRAGQVVILLQCAAGLNWKNKMPVPINNWREYIHWGHTPLIAFSVPCIISDRDWHEESVSKGILFDRARIMNLLSGGIEDDALREELHAWVNTQLSDLAQ